MRVELKTFVMLVLTLICISFWCKTSLATNLSVGYGQDVPVESWQSDGLQCSVIEVELSKEFKSPWYGSVVLDKMQGKVNLSHVIDGKRFTGSVTGLAVSLRVGIQKKLFDGLYGNFYGGFGILPKHMPEIGDSGIVGHLGAGVKYITPNWELGYEWMHMSDPLQHGDKGWNVQFITLGRRL